MVAATATGRKKRRKLKFGSMIYMGGRRKTAHRMQEKIILSKTKAKALYAVGVGSIEGRFQSAP